MTQTVTILLSTFNGEKFLREQLASFVDQSYHAWRILWRDDGSSDGTVAIMREFAGQIGADNCQELADSGDHYGAAASFLKLLQHAGEASLIAFADQDDVWLPDKLRRAVSQIETAGVGPALYCARQFLVDENLRSHRLSALHIDNGFPSCLTQNIANGNTLVMNREAAALVVAVAAPEATVHDWWSYIVVSACGGRVIFDPEPQVLYRLHKQNMIGRKQPMLGRALNAINRGPYVFMTTMRRHAGALASAELALTSKARADLKMVDMALRGSLASRVGALRCPRFKRRSRLENVLFRYWFITG